MASARSHSHKERCLVTGGSGFLGRHLVKQLLDTGKYDITVFDIREFGNSRVKCIVGDLRVVDDVNRACTDKDIVFHCATAQLIGVNASNEQLMYSVNVTGTTNIIEACIAQKVPKLIYTSTASVVFEGKSVVNVDETYPYAAKPMDFYTSTKIKGEKLILNANGSNGTLASCALRPSGIFGPGDLFFFPTMVEKARSGKLRCIIGSGQNMMEFTYVENVAQAHIQAADALSIQSKLAGQAYFITNHEPVKLWGFFDDVLKGLGFPAKLRPHVHLPFVLILMLSFVFEYVIVPLLKPFKQLSTEFTPNRIRIVACDRLFSSSKATDHFGYVPQISVKEGLRRSIAAGGAMQYKGKEDKSR